MVLFRDRRSGFTLIELLVVIAIIAVLAAILVPILFRARETARGATCASNLRQIGMALKQYTQEYNERFPSVFPDGYVRKGTAVNGREVWALAPGLKYWTEQIKVYCTDPAIFVCPSQVPPPSEYANPNSPFFLDLEDYPYSYALNWYCAGNRDLFYIQWEKGGGPSQNWCILVAENINFDWIWCSRWDWFHACWLTDDDKINHSRHGRAANFLCQDGHVVRSDRTAKPNEGGKPYWQKA